MALEPKRNYPAYERKPKAESQPIAEQAAEPKEHEQRQTPFQRFEDAELREYGLDPDTFESAPLHDLLPKLLLTDFSHASIDVVMTVQDIVSWLARTKTSEFVKEYLPLLDFDHPENFHTTASLIYVLRDVWAEVHTAEHDTFELILNDDLASTNPRRYRQITAGTRMVRETFRRIIREQKGSYILHQCAKLAVDEFDGKGYRSRSRVEAQTRVDLLSGPGKAFIYRDIVTGENFISEPEQYEHIAELLSEFESIDNTDRAQNQYAPLYTPYNRKSEIVRKLSSGALFKKELVPEMLLTPQEAVQFTDQEKDAYVTDYVFLQEAPMRAQLEKDFRVKITDLTVKEQSHFLAFLRNRTLAEAKDLEKFARKFGLDGLRTFLVTADQPELREKVFEFSRSVPKDIAEAVFTAYSQLIGSIDGIGSYLGEAFGYGGLESEVVINEITKRLLDRARGVLAGAYEYRNDPAKITELIESVHAENAIFLESFRALKGKLGIGFEQVKDLRFEKMKARELPDELKKQIPELYRKCHAGDNQEYLDEIIADSQEKLSSADSYFYTLLYKGKLIGMMRFDEKRNEQGTVVGLYAGGLNVDPDFGGGRIGDEIIQKTFESEMQRGVPIDAHVKTDSPLSVRYLAGSFVADAVVPRRGERRFHIITDPKSNAFETKLLSSNEIVERAGITGAHVQFRVFESPLTEDSIPEGFLLTKLVFRDGNYYAAFEPVPSSGVKLATAA